ncbi:PEP-CTERM sorting domain-containing protein [Mucisphaera sp.]|uniref:PEP-CTERM sorting domain-containing protein n=1 Tax=Mucisphaera sp. TaxID=2913024 RepID=UPI003D1246FB
MKHVTTFAIAAGLSGVGFAGSASADVLNDILIDLVADNNLSGVQVQFDFNDLSVSTVVNDNILGEVIEGIFTIETITVADANGSFIDEVDLSLTDVEVFGRYTLDINDPVGMLISTNSAVFEIYTDDRADGVRSVAGLTGSGGFNSPIWGGGAGISNGAAYGILDTASGGSYSLFILPNGDLAALPDLNIAPAGLPLNDPILGALGNFTGTGTISPTAVPGEFNARASFNFKAVVPEPASAALMGLAGLAMLRRR